MSVERTPYPEHFWQVGSHRVRGVVEGKGPDLVLLHGLGSRLEEYHGLTQRLSQHFKVHVWDQPGDGYSSSPGVAQTLKERADTVAEVMDHLGLEKAFLMGASQGGFVAFKLMAHHGHLVDRALLISPAGGWQPKPVVSKFLEMVSQSDLRKALYWPVAMVQINMCYAWNYPGRFDRLREHFKDLAQRDFDQVSQNYFFATSMAMADSVLEEVRRISNPVRMLWGEHDYGMPPSQGRALLANLPNAELEIVPGCGHAMGTEMPDFVVQQALAWFGR